MNSSTVFRSSRWFLLAATAVLSACGGGNADPPQPPGSPPSAQAPLVTSNPLDQTVNVGQTATFSVTASGTAPLAYQWRRGGTAIAGATSSSYTTPATVAGDNNALFDVVVSNTAGSVTSSSARLTVVTPTVTLTITQQPANVTVAAGATASFTVAATCTGGTITYQWQRLPQGGQFADIAGATSTTYTTPASQASDNASQYRAVVSCAGQTQTSTAAVLTVTSPPTSSTVRLSVLPVGLQPPAVIANSNGIAREASGSYVFVDSAGLRRLSADLSRVTTLVRSSNNPTSAPDGPAATARLAIPIGVAVDASGNIWIADNGAQTLRRFDTGGVLTTIAGTPGTRGAADGTGSAAQFSGLRGVAVGPDGDLYVADTDNQRIRRVTPAGVVTTYAGSTAGFADGAAATARFANPIGVAVGGNGDVFVADQANQRVRRILRAGAAAGNVETLAGSGTATYGDGVGTAAGIASPSRIAILGNLLFVDDIDGRVRRIDVTTREVTTLAGTAPTLARSAIADGTGTRAILEGGGGGYAANPDGSLMVSDRAQLRTVSPAGVVRTLGVMRSLGANAANPPDGLLTDQVDFLMGSSFPVSVIGDGNGNAWIGDGYASIRRVTAAGVVSSVAGLPGGVCCLDGSGTEVQFGRTFSLARDAAGNLIVGDTFAVRRVTPGGTSSLVAGAYGTLGAVDGLGAAARFNNPNGLAVDAAGNIYVSDSNAAIRRIDTSGNVTTFAGAMGQTGNVNGPAGTARFQTMRQMTIGPDGALYACDSNSLRRVAGDGSVTTLQTPSNCTAPVFDTDGALYYVAQGQGGLGADGFYRLRAGATTAERLLVAAPGLNDLSSTPQVLGTVYAMGLLAPKTLVILAGGQVLKADLP